MRTRLEIFGQEGSWFLFLIILPTPNYREHELFEESGRGLGDTPYDHTSEPSLLLVALTCSTDDHYFLAQVSLPFVRPAGLVVANAGRCAWRVRRFMETAD